MPAIGIGIGIGFGNYGVAGSPSPGFAVQLSDAGAGAVNLVPWAGTGSATFTRATSATCWSSAGLLLTVGTGVARSTYTELTGATYLGYLSEEARTNNCIQNRDFTNAAWVKTTMTAALDQVGIDGVANSASSLLATGANATAAQTVTIAAVNRPFSVYVKRLVGTGNIDLAQDGASFTTQSVANDGLWHRVTLVASQLNPVLTIRLATNADKIAVDYAMLEDAGGSARTVPLSPIATVAAAVTRNKDQLSYATAGNVLGTVGTSYAEVTGNPAINSYFVDLDATGNRPVIQATGGNQVSIFDGTTSTTTPAITLSPVTPQKVASAWGITGGTQMKAFLAGVPGTAVAFDGNMNAGANFSVGGGGTISVNPGGTIKNVKIWTVALTDGQIAAL